MRCFTGVSWITLLLFALATYVQGEESGPFFTDEPPNRLDFSNNTGSSLHCSTKGNTPPSIDWWSGEDNEPVGDVQGLRKVLSNGTLIFSPFKAWNYRQDVHASTYRCTVTNSYGTIVSRDTSVRAVVSQDYESVVYKAHVILGNAAILKCEIPSFVADFVSVTSWTEENTGEDYSHLDRYDPSRKYLVLPSGELHIANVSYEDAYMSFRCRTKHRLTKDTKLSATAGSLVITNPVGASAPKLASQIHIQFLDFKAGDDITLHCQAQGSPPPAFGWFKLTDSNEQSPVQLGDRIHQVGGNLIIRDARVDDSSKYLCVASNSVGTESVETVLTVTGFLQAQIEPSVQTVEFGRPANFTCNYQGNPVKTIEWLKDGKTLNYSEPTLILSNITRESEGMYQCFIRNDHESVQATAQLRLGEPLQLVFKFRERTLNPGPAVYLKCIARGVPTPEITWELDGTGITNTDYVQIGTYMNANGEVESHLNITESSSKDGGLYACIASSAIGSVRHTSRINVYGPPYIRPMPKTSVVAGETLIVHCPVAGYPIDSIAWEKNSRILPFNRRQYVESNGTLTISTALMFADQDTGRYTCVARNRKGDTARGTLDVQVLELPKIIPMVEIVELNQGGTFTQICVAEPSRFPSSVSWHKDALPLNQNSSSITIILSHFNYSMSVLSITGVKGSDSGEYSCLATNVAGTSSRTVLLKVKVPPRWIVEPPSENAFALGSDARLECKADGFPKPTISWKKAFGRTPRDYRDLPTDNPHVSVSSDGTLFITSITKSHEGYYRCEADAGAGASVTAVIYVGVQAPPQFQTHYRNQTSQRGSDAVLECEAEGNVPIGIVWMKNNFTVDADQELRYSIREGPHDTGIHSSLSIEMTDKPDAAIYTCVATNRFGSADSNILLIIEDQPDQPKGIKILDKNSRSVELSWTPVSNDTSPITQYFVEYKERKQMWELHGERLLLSEDSNIVHVMELKPATTYYFRIIAKNEFGESVASHTVAIITAEEAPSGAPRDIRVEYVDQSKLKITLKPPLTEEWNGAIQGYQVGYRLASSNQSYLFETVEFSQEMGKEHHLIIENLDTYTEYSIAVSAFNKIGSGPKSKEVKAYTKEGKPNEPPQDVTCTTLTSLTIRVVWSSPPLDTVQGMIQGYKVFYAPSDTWYDDTTIEAKPTQGTDTHLHGLKKYTNYTLQVLAYTNGGDGVKSSPIHCQTDQDIPEAPKSVKALVTSAESILVLWSPPDGPNGIITQYTVYFKQNGTAEENSAVHRLPPTQFTFEAKGLNQQDAYIFYVTASTHVGEGDKSQNVHLKPSNTVPAKIASFDKKYTATYKEDVKLECKAVGIPLPEVMWSVQGEPFTETEHIHMQPDGSLLIREITREDGGEYTCMVKNTYGNDTVTHTLHFQAPPPPPELSIMSTTTSSIQVKLKPSFDNEDTPIHGYNVYYKLGFGDWESIQVPPFAPTFTLENLMCGIRYQIYSTAYNNIGTGNSSEILSQRTRGNKPVAPEVYRFLEVSSTSVTLHFNAWSDGGCPINYLVIEYKPKDDLYWTITNNQVKPSGKYVIMELNAATRYKLRVSAHNTAGYSEAEYEFATLTNTGGTVAPATVRK